MNKRKHTNSIGRLSAAAARHPWRVIVVWVAAMLLAASLAGPEAWQVTTNDTSHFLPQQVRVGARHTVRAGPLRQLKNASAVTGLVRRDDGSATHARDRAHIATAVAADGYVAA